MSIVNCLQVFALNIEMIFYILPKTFIVCGQHIKPTKILQSLFILQFRSSQNILRAQLDSEIFLFRVRMY
jgi:hypothetical protein